MRDILILVLDSSPVTKEMKEVAGEASTCDFEFTLLICTYTGRIGVEHHCQPLCISSVANAVNSTGAWEWIFRLEQERHKGDRVQEAEISDDQLEDNEEVLDSVFEETGNVIVKWVRMKLPRRQLTAIRVHCFSSLIM